MLVIEIVWNLLESVVQVVLLDLPVATFLDNEKKQKLPMSTFFEKKREGWKKHKDYLTDKKKRLEKKDLA